MSDHRRRPLLRLYPRRSLRLSLLLPVLHLVAAAVLFAVPLDAPLRLALLVLVVLSLAYAIWVLALGRAPWSVRGATWSEDGWSLEFGNGQSREATLLPSTLLTRGLVILNFRVSRMRYHSLVLTESVIGSELLRRLRARLRLERGLV